MVDAPEKLWMTAEGMGWPGSFRSFRMSDLEHPDEYPAYVRADLYEQVERERDDAKQALQNEIVAHGNTILGKAETAESLAGARVKALIVELKQATHYDCIPSKTENAIDNAITYLSALAEPAETAERLAGARVKALDEDDYEEITNAAGIAMRRASRGIRGQVITVQDSFDWWVIKETERRILSALAEPAGEAEPVAWMDSTGSEIHPIIKNYQKEDMIRNGGVQAKRAVHYSIALYTK